MVVARASARGGGPQAANSRGGCVVRREVYPKSPATRVAVAGTCALYSSGFVDIFPEAARIPRTRRVRATREAPAGWRNAHPHATLPLPMHACFSAHPFQRRPARSRPRRARVPLPQVTVASPLNMRTRGRFNLKRLSRVLADRLVGTPFDRALKAAQTGGAREFVFGWNRGLGDVALGLVPLFARIRAAIPGSRIVVFARADLEDALRMAGVDEIVVVPGLVRGDRIDPRRCAARTGRRLSATAVVFADPDPTRWLDGRRQEFPPELAWSDAWGRSADRLIAAEPSRITIGAHVHSETAQHYGYVKDWPAASWGAVFDALAADDGVRFVLFGNEATPLFEQPNVVDLRGRTGFLELIAVVRRRCRILIAPDSGILTTAYYLAQDFPLDIVSLWSDPRQGILKQGCPSPNPRLVHVPLVGAGEDVRNIEATEVRRVLGDAIARARAEAKESKA